MDVQAFHDLMGSASQFGMRKVLACCEHRIACDDSGKYNNALQTISSGSAARIVQGLRYRLSHCGGWAQAWTPEQFLKLMPDP